MAWQTSPVTQPAATRTVRVTGSPRTPLNVDKSQILVDAGEPRPMPTAAANGNRHIVIPPVVHRGDQAESAKHNERPGYIHAKGSRKL
jgi:hypothetical protein